MSQLSLLISASRPILIISDCNDYMTPWQLSTLWQARFLGNVFLFPPLLFFLSPLWRTLIHTWNNTGTNIWTVNTAVRATERWQASRVGCAKHSSDPQRVNILKAVNSSLEASQMWFRMQREENKCEIELELNWRAQAEVYHRASDKNYYFKLTVKH